MTNLTGKIINNLDNLDEQFKKYFIEKAFNKIKNDMKHKIEEQIFKDKLEFIENNCEIISEVRNINLKHNYPEVNMPSYCFYTCYDIIDEFKKKREYPDEIEWLYLYRLLDVPHYGDDNIKPNPDILNYNYETESSEYEEDGYDSYS